MMQAAALSREDITAKAMELVEQRVRFRPYGREPFGSKRTAGLDCVGVVIWVGEQLNLLKDVYTPPYAFPPQKEIFDFFDVYGTEINEPREGAVVIFRTHEGSPMHCGILSQSSSGWMVIGVAPTIIRAYVTAFPLNEYSMGVWKYYDYKGIG